MTRRILLTVLMLAACIGTAAAEDFSVIDPAKNPAKARFMALAQEKFNKDPDAMFNTSRVAAGNRQAVFECGMKSVLADIPEADVQRLVDMIEGRAPSDPALAKWFQFDKTENPARHGQVSARAKAICPQFANLMK
ncbi:hypothetical protein [Dongia sp.]|uniref:hypothetical protein n=1 Tax=Dongia sp. TaxID=1977262 RepID=UPI0035B14C89